MTLPLPLLRVQLAPALEERWRHILVRVAKGRGWPSVDDAPEVLAERVAALSQAYNSGQPFTRNSDLFLPARLGFSFARDVPKMGAAVAELILTGNLHIPEKSPLRILDLGAGLGASTWGVVRALASSGVHGSVHATLLDSDKRALELAREIAKAAQGEGEVTVHAHTGAHDITTSLSAIRKERFDIILIGQALSEMHLSTDGVERVDAQSALVQTLLKEHLSPRGSLVLLEPALRVRTRHLHRVRDGLIARGATVFAPCLHAASCPALTREGDWCHEDLPIDLPDWLVAVGRAAGLRYERLTFSYLVLRRDTTTLAQALLSEAKLARVVSSPLISKGKRELFLCGQLADGPGGVRAMLLDRDSIASEGAREFAQAVRGDVLAMEPMVSAEGAKRIGRDTTVRRMPIKDFLRCCPRTGAPASKAVVSCGETKFHSHKSGNGNSA